jgi:hypothetical protein
METSPKDAGRATGAYIVAALLIVIGGLALVANLTGAAITGLSIPLAIGIAFVVAYAMTRKYGFLVPAGVLTGFGTGLLVASLLDVTDNAAFILIGGGVGFLLIYIVDIVVSGSALRWWPLIPGGILTAVGTSIAQQEEGLKQLGMWWPVVLIALGVLLLFGRRSQSRLGG